MQPQMENFELKSNAENLRTKVDDLRTDVGCVKTIKESLNSDRSSLKAEYARVESQKRALETLQTSLTAQNTAIRNHLTNAQSDLSSLSTGFKATQERLEVEENERRLLTTRQSSLAAENIVIRKSLAAAQSELISHSKDQKATQERVDAQEQLTQTIKKDGVIEKQRQRESVLDLESHVEDLQTKLTQADKKQKAFEDKTARDLQKLRAELKDIVEAKQHQIRQEEEKSASLGAMLEAGKDREKLLANQIDLGNEAHAKLETKVKDLEKTTLQHQTCLQQMEAKVHGLSDTVDGLEVTSSLRGELMEHLADQEGVDELSDLVKATIMPDLHTLQVTSKAQAQAINTQSYLHNELSRKADDIEELLKDLEVIVDSNSKSLQRCLDSRVEFSQDYFDRDDIMKKKVDGLVHQVEQKLTSLQCEVDCMKESVKESLRDNTADLDRKAFILQKQGNLIASLKQKVDNINMSLLSLDDVDHIVIQQKNRNDRGRRRKNKKHTDEPVASGSLIAYKQSSFTENVPSALIAIDSVRRLAHEDKNVALLLSNLVPHLRISNIPGSIASRLTASSSNPNMEPVKSMSAVALRSSDNVSPLFPQATSWYIDTAIGMKSESFSTESDPLTPPTLTMASSSAAVMTKQNNSFGITSHDSADEHFQVGSGSSFSAEFVGAVGARDSKSQDFSEDDVLAASDNNELSAPTTKKKHSEGHTKRRRRRGQGEKWRLAAAQAVVQNDGPNNTNVLSVSSGSHPCPSQLQDKGVETKAVKEGAAQEKAEEEKAGEIKPEAPAKPSTITSRWAPSPEAAPFHPNEEMAAKAKVLEAKAAREKALKEKAEEQEAAMEKAEKEKPDASIKHASIMSKYAPPPSASSSKPAKEHSHVQIKPAPITSKFAPPPTTTPSSKRPVKGLTDSKWA